MNGPPEVSIRPYTEADVDELVAAVQESFAEIAPWMVWCHRDYATEDAAFFIRATIAGREAGTSFEYAIVDDRGALVGTCGINHINSIDRFANLGYWIRTSRTGRGFAPAAVRLLADWTFANTELNRLEIVAALGNVRSQRVALKAGALREAVLRQRLLVGGAPSDAVMHSLVRS